MGVSVINLSPRGERGVSGCIEKLIRENSFLNDEKGYENILLISPLYVDGLPSSAVEWLKSYSHKEETKRVYCIINCGFFEGEQSETAMMITENFALSIGAEFCGGMGIGGGGIIPVLSSFAPFSYPYRKLKGQIEELCRSIEGKEKYPIRYFSAGINRKIYKAVSEMCFKRQALKNDVRI